MTDQEVLQAMGQMLQESEMRMSHMMDQKLEPVKAEIQESEKRMSQMLQESEKRMSHMMDQKLEPVKAEIQESEKRMGQMLQESEKRIMQNAAVLMDAQFTPQFKLLAEGQQVIIDQVKDLEKRIDSIEEKIYDYT